MAEAVTDAPQAPKPPRVTFREVFGNREFRAIWLAELASITGDQFARVALTVLVYQRTGSPLLTALTYAASYLSWVVGGLGLAGLADRYPRRAVMIACDLVRMLLVAAMVLPGQPLWATVALLFAVTTVNAPFQGARSALRATILPGDRYTLGLAVSQITRQAGNVAGFVAGGVIVAVLGSRNALAIDAATFAFSALILWAGVRHHPAPESARRPSRLGEIAAGLSLVFGNQRLRTLALLGWLGAFYTVAEALAVPYAARLGRGTVAAGLIFAAVPFGSAVGSAAFSRLVRPPVRLRWMGPLAVAACLMPLACLAGPGLVLSLVILALAGVFSGYQVAANTLFVASAPDSGRGQAYAMANAGLQVGQGLTYVIAGAAAAIAAPAVVIAVSGLVGAVVAAWLALVWRRASLIAADNR